MRATLAPGNRHQPSTLTGARSSVVPGRGQSTYPRGRLKKRRGGRLRGGRLSTPPYTCDLACPPWQPAPWRWRGFNVPVVKPGLAFAVLIATVVASTGVARGHG